MLRSQDYHAHISKVHRTPSVLPDVPRYPNAHQVFTKKVISEEDKGFNGGYHKPQTNERLAVVEEYEQTTDPEVIYEENVDAETNQDYPRKNKGGFELQKWKTFRL